ncbi:polyphenol oxidase I, chloroplastic-like [Salvia splendens]|uniref:polyphenol oxidase I, chloroplastic-like n=1 Tax=Salvia splendens TaxID=180675 RepID=UPI001C253B34|nr:polyphenol oxidase I, chloroplastic-like [Salvia splendens]
MASLQSSFTVLATTPTPRNSSLSKPSLLPTTNARRSHRFRVSCSSNGGGGVDRRNMLLGLGGLYGASNLISGRKANADPILPPDLSQCDPTGATTTSGGQTVSLDVDCCPPYTDIQSDYKLPSFTTPRVRPAANRGTLKPEYIAKYQLAIQSVKRMRDLDVTDPDDPRGFTQQANIHCAYCNGPYDQPDHPGLDLQVHNSWLFFPFHRWYLYFFERILGSLIDDPTFAIPYWNWDNPRGMFMPEMFTFPGTPAYDANRDPSHIPTGTNPVVTLNVGSTVTDPVQIISNNLTQMYNEMIGTPASATDFMGQPYRDGDAPHGFSGGGTSEQGSHTAIHVWVGDPNNEYNEDMGNFYSAGRDPLFYCHHANVDRMWTLWKDIPADYSKEITDPDFLKSAFMFYDKNKNLVRVTVADALDYKRMGYEYEPSNTPWMNYRPQQRLVPANLESLSKTAQTVAKLFPLTLNNTVKVIVPKPATGKADETLVIENIVTDNTKLVKFGVFINDEDDKPEEVDRAEYAGSFTQLPHRVKAKQSTGNLRLNLKELYENINIADDKSVVVTIVPIINGSAVTIGSVKIVPRVA